jgi:hypothetical protein
MNRLFFSFTFPAAFRTHAPYHIELIAVLFSSDPLPKGRMLSDVHKRGQLFNGRSLFPLFRDASDPEELAGRTGDLSTGRQATRPYRLSNA